jgi:hypothetical protein
MTYLDGLTYLAWLPWTAALVMALSFGALAARAGVNWLLWACGGACFGLVATAIILGVSQAAFIPMSHEAVAGFQAKSIAITVAVLLLFGWMFTANLHGLWRWVRRQVGRP